MKIIKENYNTIIASVSALFAFFLAVIYYGFSYVYIPNNYALFYILHVICCIFLCIFGIKWRDSQNRTSQIIGKIMEVIFIIYAVVTAIAVRINGDDFYAVNVPIMPLFLLQIITGLVFSCINIKSRCAKTLLAVGHSIVFAVMLWVMFWGFVMYNFGSCSIVDTLASPNGEHEVKVVEMDSGALGGDVVIFAGKAEKINLLLGTLKGENERLWTGRWGIYPSICWIDNETVMIDNEEYCIIGK